jgi:branched-chain amino acid transport system ATP-binding protein
LSLLRTIDLKKSFGETRAVDGVDFAVTEGEVIALVGPNGAGKTSLVNLLSAYLTPDSGQIWFGDVEITNMSVTERIQIGIARSFQIANLFDDLSARDHVALAIFSRDGKTYKFTSVAENDEEVIHESDDFLNRFGLGGKGQVLAKELAQGERKLLDIAVAYALKPKFLFLDEPTSGVSTRDKAQIMDTISSAVLDEGVTVAIIEHDMDIVFTYSDRIIVMVEGRILADGTPDEIRGNKQVETAFLGLG